MKEIHITLYSLTKNIGLRTRKNFKQSDRFKRSIHTSVCSLVGYEIEEIEENRDRR
jgi:hypothetical protein